MTDWDLSHALGGNRVNLTSCQSVTELDSCSHSNMTLDCWRNQISHPRTCFWYIKPYNWIFRWFHIFVYWRKSPEHACCFWTELYDCTAGHCASCGAWALNSLVSQRKLLSREGGHYSSPLRYFKLASECILRNSLSFVILLYPAHNVVLSFKLLFCTHHTFVYSYLPYLNEFL